MRALAFAVLLWATPTGPAAKLVAVWLDHGSPYMELRPDGSGRIGAIENTWSFEKDTLRVHQTESGDEYELPATLKSGGKQLEIIVQGLPVVLERGKQKPAAHPPPPPKKPSEMDAPPDAGVAAKKKTSKGKK